ncbi:hypothetical protein H1P_3140010 [Hyella patelloides LEGE 07179]|uniref:Uncharacterized protein n=1 Tax=Hyella patelloides LEGE 07179 TaxID=945734 RepID=A0A563VUQ0_9CYAN|nr:hypothetical protein H1P_3140010 [Hyella patelloides LEGE 07179]
MTTTKNLGIYTKVERRNLMLTSDPASASDALGSASRDERKEKYFKRVNLAFCHCREQF